MFRLGRDRRTRIVAAVMNGADMTDTLQFLDLPLHPLVVHAVVVLLPLAVIALVLSQFWGAARRRLGLVTPLAALVVVILVPVTIAAGRSLADLVGPLPTHERYGVMLLPWSIGLLVVAVAQWAWFRWGSERLRAGRRAPAATAGTVLLGIAVIVVSVGSLIVLFLAGETGSRAVWSSVMP